MEVERLIRSVRKVLNSKLNVQSLDEEGLHTVLCEAEAILNSRPITKPSTDPNDLEALTPNSASQNYATPATRTVLEGRPICSPQVEASSIYV